MRDIDGIIRNWSAGAENLYQWSAEEAVGRVSHELLHTEFSRPLAEINSELGAHGSWTGSVRQVRRDGSPLVIASTWVLHQYEPNTVIENNSDITAFVRSAAQPQGDYAKLQRLNEDLEQFTFAAAHDLQEPLRTIRMYAELLRLQNGNGHGKLDVIINAADRMQDLLRELMVYVETVKKAPNLSATADANEACRVALENLQETATAAKAEIEVGPLPVVPMDRVRLSQIFQNLISNSIKYRSPDRPLSVRIAAEQRDRRWIFSVADNGLGIPAQHQHSIFEGFKRLHSSNIPGTGLGLALCRRILELHNGSIWVQSQEGNGSTFYFDLPVSR